MQGVPSIRTFRRGGEDAWPLQTAEVTQLKRTDARLVLRVRKAFKRESHASHLSVSFGEDLIPDRYSWFSFSKGVCEGHHARLRKEASVECCGLFLDSGLLFILFFLKMLIFQS